MSSQPIFVPGNEVREFGPDNTYRWATVTDTTPLQIRLDGDSVGLPLVPDSVVNPADLAQGDRVWVQMYGRRIIILGKGGGRPAPLEILKISDGDPDFVYSSAGWQIASSAASDTPTLVVDGRLVTFYGRIKYTTTSLTLGSTYQPIYLPDRYAALVPRAQLACWTHGGASALGPDMGAWIALNGSNVVSLNLMAATGQSSWTSSTWIYFGGSWLRDLP